MQDPADSPSDGDHRPDSAMPVGRQLPAELIELEPEGWGSRLRGLIDRFGLLPVLASAVLLVGAGVLAMQLFAPAPQPVDDTLPMAPQATSAVSPVEPFEATSVLVHAAGAVVRPGVYELPTGSRFIDLVEAAGGVLPQADPNRLNLAEELSDGARVYVLSVGEVAPPGVVPAGDSPTGEGRTDSSDPVDINTADVAALETLPGVGPATAAAIIDHREQYGPFGVIDDLIEVRGIGEAKLAGLRDMAVAR